MLRKEIHQNSYTTTVTTKKKYHKVINTAKRMYHNKLILNQLINPKKIWDLIKYESLIGKGI